MCPMLRSSKCADDVCGCNARFGSCCQAARANRIEFLQLVYAFYFIYVFVALLLNTVNMGFRGIKQVSVFYLGTKALN